MIKRCDETYRAYGDRAFLVWDIPNELDRDGCLVWASNSEGAAEEWASHADVYHDQWETPAPFRVYVREADAPSGSMPCYEIEREYEPTYSATFVDGGDDGDVRETTPPTCEREQCWIEDRCIGECDGDDDG